MRDPTKGSAIDDHLHCRPVHSIFVVGLDFLVWTAARSLAHGPLAVGGSPHQSGGILGGPSLRRGMGVIHSRPLSFLWRYGYVRALRLPLSFRLRRYRHSGTP